MKLYNPILEATLIRAICSLDKVSAGQILAQVSEGSFYDESSLEAFQFIRNESLANGAIPKWEDVTVNPNLAETSRDFLLGTESHKVKNKRDLTKLLDSTKKYEKYRTLYYMANDVIEQISSDKPNLEDIMVGVDSTVAELKTDVRGVKEQIAVIGKGNNTTDLVEQRLNGETIRTVPTGFRAFDEVNGGLPLGEAVLMAGNTGGGKTAIIAIQMLLNMARFVPSIVVPLEMTEGQTMDRILSNLSKIPINKFTSGKLTDDDKIKVRKNYKKFAKELRDLETSYNIWAPECDVSMTEVLYSLLPFNYDVYVIDYIGLLKGLSGDDQVRQLGAAVREAKIFAKNNNKLVIILAQLNDDNKVKYSRAMVEHVSNCWIWEYNEASRESGIVTMNPIKSRNQDPTPFDLAVDFSIMRAGDVTEADFQTREDPSGKKLKEKVGQSKDRLKKLSQEIDEYDLDDDED